MPARRSVFPCDATGLNQLIKDYSVKAVYFMRCSYAVASAGACISLNNSQRTTQLE